MPIYRNRKKFDCGDNAHGKEGFYAMLVPL
ncbi:Uncharacterised protein [Burkholderia pseudomallei]|nr:Uncharacterised protein [Burkholderia pseudomallei]CAJ4604752.1 Uncharacterised protein [Burkholderia pseudomallei]CAJ5583321.1 Uncharacterised protein [Burkholderia pseudomallei]CAJ5595445.1 Uncharacterised protein [Burkholderia pseudomallei]CAJ6392382.1 Uncharacterised protein [Burkholderia pseudomallei]